MFLWDRPTASQVQGFCYKSHYRFPGFKRKRNSLVELGRAELEEEGKEKEANSDMQLGREACHVSSQELFSMLNSSHNCRVH